MALTIRALQSLKPGEWLSDDARRGAGRLVAYGMKGGGAAFYFRYVGPGGKRDTLPLGHFDLKGRHGLTLQQASDRAGELSRRYQAGERDLRAALEAEARASQPQPAAEPVVEAAPARTLGMLLLAYADQLERDGKTSAKSVRQAVKLHVETEHPVLWAMPAAEVSTDDLMPVLTRMIEAGTPREAAKVRSYLRAAYSAAIRSRQDARGLAALRELRITSNPARDLATIDGATQRRERALSLAELRAYWARAKDVPLLAFHLLTGCQRIEQLARLTTADYDADLQAVVLLDPKGRRKQPREHVVPLLPAATAALKAMRFGDLGPYLFTANAGESGASYFIALNRLQAVQLQLQVCNALPGAPSFTLGDLRRTVETRLAAAGVSKEVRAQLQSHGLGGVQGQHYDRHDYLTEKRTALETLWRLLVGEA